MAVGNFHCYFLGDSTQSCGLELYCTSHNDALCFNPSEFDEDIDNPTHKNLRDIIKSTNPLMAIDDMYLHLAWKSDYTMLALVLTNKR